MWGGETAKFALPTAVANRYHLQNNLADRQILELYRDLSVTVEKQVTDPDHVGTDPNDEFTMEVTLDFTNVDAPTNAAGEKVLPVAYSYELDAGDGTTTTGDLMISDTGKLTISMKAGGTAKIWGLPTGTVYAVAEQDPSALHYEVSYDGNENGHLAENLMQDDGTVVAANTEFASTTITNKKYANVNLTVEKKVLGNMGEVTKDFIFTIDMIDESSGTPVDVNNITYTKHTASGDTLGTLNSGETFTLKHGEYITLMKLPLATKYTVTETVGDGYVVTTEVNDAAQPGNTGIVTGIADNDTKILFTNKKQIAVLTGSTSNMAFAKALFLLFLGLFTGAWWYRRRRKKI